MKELSIFVDESGDFGNYSKHSPYYIVSMVFHDQEEDIKEQVNKIQYELSQMGYNNSVIHTEPLIRRENEYAHYSPNERRSILMKLYYFALKCQIQYKVFIFNKKEYNNIFEMQNKMIKVFSQFIKEHLTYFQAYEKIILYYDNGQHELTHILHEVLSTELVHYENRKVLPSDYRLFQVADLICTLELVAIKAETNELSKSEQLIFHSKRDLKKDFLKNLRNKAI